MEEKTVRKKRV